MLKSVMCFQFKRLNRSKSCLQLMFNSVCNSQFNDETATVIRIH